MLTLAQMAVILTRGIDLSVAANLALTGMICALVSRAEPSLPIAGVIALAMVLGAALGAVNGGLIAFFGIPPIVVTLGTLSIYRGAIYLIAGGAWLTSKDMTPAFLAFPKLSVLGVPILVWIAAAVSIGFWYYLNHTASGRALYAVGGNPVAALYCGIDLPRQQLIVYTLAGAVSGLCGVLWVSRYGIAYTDIAQGYELTIIAACVIGGVSIAGGVGSVAGALLGALFLGVVVNALPVINVSPFWQTLISGAVILAAVVINARLLEKRRRASALITATGAQRFVEAWQRGRLLSRTPTILPPFHRYDVADRPPRRLADFVLSWETILVALLIAVFVVNSLASPYFLDFYNLSDATFNFSEKAILALAMTLLIIVRDIDLSIAAIIALASLAMGLAAQAGAPTAALIGLGLGVGAVCGVVNGALVTGFALPSIVVTIGTMSLFRGIAQVALGDQALTKYPAPFQAIGQGYISGRLPIPISVVIFLALATLVFGIVLHRTTDRPAALRHWRSQPRPPALFSGMSASIGFGSCCLS